MPAQPMQGASDGTARANPEKQMSPRVVSLKNQVVSDGDEEGATKWEQPPKPMSKPSGDKRYHGHTERHERNHREQG